MKDLLLNALRLRVAVANTDPQEKAERMSRLRQVGIDIRAAGGRPKGTGTEKRGKPQVGRASQRALMIRAGEKLNGMEAVLP